MKKRSSFLLLFLSFFICCCYHSSSWQNIFNRAQQHQRDGDLRSAFKIGQKALKLAKSSYGANDIRTARNELFIGSLLRKKFALKEANNHLSAAVDVLEQNKDNALLLAQCVYELALVHRSLGQMTEAENRIRQALIIREEKLAPQHEDVIKSTSLLASILSWKKEDDNANKLYRRALEMTEQSFGRSSTEVAELLEEISTHYAQRSEKEALDCLRRALNIREALFRKGDIKSEVKLMATIDSLVSRLESQIAYSEIIKLLERKVEIVGPTSLLACGDLEKLGDYYDREKNYAQAERTYLLALQNLERTFGAKSTKCKKTLTALVQLYEAWGRKEMALPIKKRLTQLSEK